MFTVSPPTMILDVKLPSTLSEAVAPCSVYVSPIVKLIVDAPFKLIIGAMVSAATITVLTASVAALPAASLTLYVTKYVPAILVFTVSPPTMILDVKLPSTLSIAVAPSSV